MVSAITCSVLIGIPLVQTILESGQFPACCPMCRAEGKVPKSGEITEPWTHRSPSIDLPCERGVITKSFQFRFVNAMRRSDDTYVNRDVKDEFIECPREGCDISLYGQKIVPDKPSFGQCPCGQVVCLLCLKGIELVAPYEDKEGQIVNWKHNCEKANGSLEGS